MSELLDFMETIGEAVEFSEGMDDQDVEIGIPLQQAIGFAKLWEATGVEECRCIVRFNTPKTKSHSKNCVAINEALKILNRPGGGNYV